MGEIRSGVDSYYFARFPGDREHVLGLLPWFDVTNARRARPVPGAPSIYYLKPLSKDVARFLGVDESREVLYLFSPHPQIEARDIQARDEAFNMDHLRLDPRLSIIGSADAKTGERVTQYLLQDPERSPLVGLSLSELQAVTRGDDLYAIFKARHFVRDYFSMEAPLTEEAMFFGRDSVVAELAERIGAGQNSGLFGLRRIGKTSLLYAVARRCQSAGLGFAYYRDLSPAYHLRWWRLLELIITEVAAQLSLGKSSRHKLHALSGGYDEFDAAVKFGADVEFLATRVPHSRLVLLLDEIEYVTFDISPAPHWLDDFLSMWATMRSVHQNSRGRFTFVIAGVNPYAVERHRIGNHDNPLFSTTREFFVAPLTKDGMSEMIRSLGRMMGLSVERPFLDLLYEEFGGHPFLTRQACSHLLRHIPERPGVLTKDLLQGDLPHLRQALEPNVRQILTVLETWYPLEYELLQELATGNEQDFCDFAASDPEFASHVEGYGLVRSPRVNPVISIGLVGSVLRERAPESAISNLLEDHREISTSEDVSVPEEKWEEVIAEISARRNRLEKTLRERARLGLELAYGKQKTVRLLESVHGKRKDSIINLAYEDMWENLYFPELIDVFLHNWETFKNWLAEDPDKFKSIMTTINQGRHDAHARSIDVEELAYLRVCFRKIEQKCGLT